MIGSQHILIEQGELLQLGDIQLLDPGFEADRIHDARRQMAIVERNQLFITNQQVTPSFALFLFTIEVNQLAVGLDELGPGLVVLLD